jgi:hypothetical protein
MAAFYLLYFNYLIFSQLFCRSIKLKEVYSYEIFAYLCDN